MTTGQINTTQIVSQAIMSAMTVSVLATALGIMIAACEGIPMGLEIPVTQKAIDDMKSAFGAPVVNKAVEEVGSDNILVLAAKVEDLYVADMRKKYGDWETVTGISQAPAGDLRTANEIAKALHDKKVTAQSVPEKVSEAVSTGKRRGRQVAQPVKDTKTGIVYGSKARAGMAVAAKYGLDPKNHFIWYEVIKKDPKRFVRVSPQEVEGI